VGWTLRFFFFVVVVVRGICVDWLGFIFLFDFIYFYLKREVVG
jgi:hypothetical protein